MYKKKISAASIATYLQRKSYRTFNWHLRFRPVSGSTELDLSNWIFEQPMPKDQPRAIFAARQNNGFGQKGRFWQSPPGGVWVSAAIPCKGINQNGGLFGLAVAYALSERLEKWQISTQIKWPNDLLFCDKKLAGFLPKLIFRGQSFRLARVGIGMNIYNRTPSNGISLAEILGVKRLNLSEWSAEVLISVERAIYLLKNEDLFYLEVEKRLVKKDVVDPINGELWNVDGLDNNGGLKLKKGDRRTIWNRLN
tara:strand:+ start:488 stop:1243 length:756 start_codon:yes stop_codon:yes gene_type:complete